MKTLETLLVDIKDGIAVITINRPKALNAINHKVMSEVGYLFSEGLPLDELKGIIITGSGDKAFIAGADIKEFIGLTAEEGSEKSAFGHKVFNSIEQCPVPVIAAINGYSLGGGNELAMSCHLRICSDNAMFGQPEVKLGLIPGYGGSQRFIQYLGKGRAMELLLTADMIDATKALEYGLVTHVTPPEELMSVATKIISKIGSRGPDAVAKTIETVNAYFDKKQDGFGLEIDYFGKAMASDQTKEGVAAFIEKRKPNFRGTKS
jgi:enoyl-CoA hydratase